MDLSRLAPIFAISVYLQNKLLADAKSNRALFMIVSKLFGLLRFHLNSLRDLKLGIAIAVLIVSIFPLKTSCAYFLGAKTDYSSFNRSLLALVPSKEYIY